MPYIQRSSATQRTHTQYEPFALQIFLRENSNANKRTWVTTRWRKDDGSNKYSTDESDQDKKEKNTHSKTQIHMSCVSLRCKQTRASSEWREKKQNSIGLFSFPVPNCHILRLSNFMPIVCYSLPYALHCSACSYFRFTVCGSSFTDGIFAKAVNVEQLPNHVSERKKNIYTRNKYSKPNASYAHVLEYNFSSYFPLSLVHILL